MFIPTVLGFPRTMAELRLHVHYVRSLGLGINRRFGKYEVQILKSLKHSKFEKFGFNPTLPT